MFDEFRMTFPTSAILNHNTFSETLNSEIQDENFLEISKHVYLNTKKFKTIGTHFEAMISK